MISLLFLLIFAVLILWVLTAVVPMPQPVLLIVVLIFLILALYLLLGALDTSSTRAALVAARGRG